MLAGASYMDAGLIYGVAFQSVYSILWDVVDAINETPSVGPFKFRLTEAACKTSADKWQVGVWRLHYIVRFFASYLPLPGLPPSS